MTAGSSQLPVLLTSLRMLRRTGCTLPVEIYLGSTTDYDHQLCDEILPGLNACCFVVEDVLVQAETGVLTRPLPVQDDGYLVLFFRGSTALRL